LAFVLLRRGHFAPDRQLRRRCLGMLGASVAMGAVLWGLQVLVFAPPPHGLLRFAALGGLVGAGMVAYALAASLLGAYDLRDVGRLMSRRRLRGNSGSAISSPPTAET
jgi:putative peptidoglycan lipid II flippase